MILDHIKKLVDLIGLCLSAARLDAEAARNVRMLVDLVAAIDAVKFEAEGLEDALEVGEAAWQRAIARGGCRVFRFGSWLSR